MNGVSGARAAPSLGSLSCVRPRPQARARLVCFAHAGGGPGAYRRWSAALGPRIEVWTACLPGRGPRSDEPFERSWERLVDDIAWTLASSDEGRPDLLLGHSLGAIVAYEVARELQARGRHPAHLFVSGSRAPHRLGGHWAIPADDDRLVEEVDVRYGAVPPAVRAEPDLLRRFVPILRADLELAAAYVFRPGERLGCPVTALNGSADRTASSADVELWREQADGPFAAVTLPGAHFFIHSELAALAQLITATIE